MRVLLFDDVVAMFLGWSGGDIVVEPGLMLEMFCDRFQSATHHDTGFHCTRRAALEVGAIVYCFQVLCVCSGHIRPFAPAVCDLRLHRGAFVRSRHGSVRRPATPHQHATTTPQTAEDLLSLSEELWEDASFLERAFVLVGARQRLVLAGAVVLSVASTVLALVESVVIGFGTSVALRFAWRGPRRPSVCRGVLYFCLIVGLVNLFGCAVYWLHTTGVLILLGQSAAAGRPILTQKGQRVLAVMLFIGVHLLTAWRRHDNINPVADLVQRARRADNQAQPGARAAAAADGGNRNNGRPAGGGGGGGAAAAAAAAVRLAGGQVPQDDGVADPEVAGDMAGLVLDADADALAEDGAAADENMVWNAFAAPNDRDAVVDQRALAAQANGALHAIEPSMRLPHGVVIENMTEKDFFEHFLPRTWIRQTMIPAMNETATATLDRGPAVTYNDLLVVLGVLMYYASQTMSTFRELWSTSTHPFWRPTPHPIAEFISRDKCERIMRLFGCIKPAEREDDTHPLKGLLALIDAFNEHWRECFQPSSWTCMDESTSATTAKHDCAKVRCMPCTRLFARCGGIA